MSELLSTVKYLTTDQISPFTSVFYSCTVEVEEAQTGWKQFNIASFSYKGSRTHNWKTGKEQSWMNIVKCLWTINITEIQHMYLSAATATDSYGCIYVETWKDNKQVTESFIYWATCLADCSCEGSHIGEGNWGELLMKWLKNTHK